MSVQLTVELNLGTTWCYCPGTTLPDPFGSKTMLLLDVVTKRWLLVSRFALAAGCICDQISDDRQSRAIDRQRAADIEVGQLCSAVVVENDPIA